MNERMAAGTKPIASCCAARIGSVPYLNAKPLIFGLEQEVVMDHPSRLAARLAQGEFDVALIPVAEVLAHPGYVIVDGICIACRGPVYSVILAHRRQLKETHEIVVDASSRSSAMMLRVLMQKRFGLKPKYIIESLVDKQCDADAQMLIGDQAIRFHQNPGDWQLLDLGQVWFEWTHLPFVFAVWAVHEKYRDAAGLAAKLRRTREAGLASIETIVARETGGDAAFRRNYFAKNVHFSLGAKEKESLGFFQQQLLDMGELKERHDLRFIS